MLEPKRPRTWIVVADGARARFFTPSVDGRKLVAARPADMVAPESLGHARDLKSDKPGRSHAAARTGARHALEPAHDPHKLRGLLTARVQRAIGEEIAKDLTNETAAGLWRHLQPVMKPTL